MSTLKDAIRQSMPWTNIQFEALMSTGDICHIHLNIPPPHVTREEEMSALSFVKSELRQESACDGSHWNSIAAMFRRLFGKSKSKSDEKERWSSSRSRRRSEDDEHRNARQTIDRLQDTEQIMEKKLEKFNDDIRALDTETRECLTKKNPDRSAAMKLLKRKKQLEQQRDRLWQIKDNVQLVNEQVQSAQFNRQITDSLNVGHEHLKGIQKRMPTKRIEEILDGLAEEIDVSNGINDLLSTAIPTSDPLIIDDLELERQLDQFNEEILHDQLTQIHLPSAPSSHISSTTHPISSSLSNNDVRRQLAELERLTSS